MDNITLGALAISTAWVVYYVSIRRKGGHQVQPQKTETDLKNTPESVKHKDTDRSASPLVYTGAPSDGVGRASIKQPVPSFTVSDNHEADDGERTPTESEFGSKNLQQQQRQTPSLPTLMQPPPIPPQTMAPPPAPPRLKPPTFSPSPSNRMAPPPRPTGSSLRPPPSAASSLRAPVRPQQSLSASTLPSNGKASSRQVTLAPGHSPLDWATLTHDHSAVIKLRGRDACRISTTLFSSPHTLLRIPPSTLRRFNGRKGRDAWTSYQGRVYNLTAYLSFHPGGEEELLKGGGRGSEKLFNDVHPWVNWDGMLKECIIGMLVAEEDDRGVKVDREGQLIFPKDQGESNPLDEMD